MRQVAIIGAGELGGALAHVLARREIARVITLIDEHARVASGKALDISQAAPVEGFATELSGSAESSAASGAEVIVIADRFRSGEWQGDEGFQLLNQLSRLASNAVIVCAGAMQVDLVDRGVRELRIERGRLIGSAPEALGSGVRALVALAANASPGDVALSVFGRPPAHTVVAWGDATIGGFLLTRVMSEPTRQRLEARIEALWPPGPHSLATAAAKVIAAIGGRTRHLSSCYVAPDASAGGVRTRTAALPVRLGPNGIVEVVMPSLSVVEQVALDNAIQV